MSAQPAVSLAARPNQPSTGSLTVSGTERNLSDSSTSTIIGKPCATNTWKNTSTLASVRAEAGYYPINYRSGMTQVRSGSRLSRKKGRVSAARENSSLGGYARLGK